jgi:hypothetical protein
MGLDERTVSAAQQFILRPVIAVYPKRLLEEPGGIAEKKHRN